MDVASKFKNVTFLNYASDEKFNSKFQKFADPFHLNEKGSKEFTYDLISHLK